MSDPNQTAYADQVWRGTVSILQNTQVVETKILFMTISMPRALLLIITFVAGFITGTLFVSGLLRKTGKKGQKAKR